MYSLEVVSDLGSAWSKYFSSKWLLVLMISFFLLSGTWVTFGAQVSDEVGLTLGPNKKYMSSTWDFQQCGMCDQQSLRTACVYVQSDQSLNSCLNILWVLSYWLNEKFGVSKLKRRLQRLVWVYTCQNTTLLEITCLGSYEPAHEIWVLITLYSNIGSYILTRVLIACIQNNGCIQCTISLAISYVSHLSVLIFVQYQTFSISMTRTWS